MNKTILIHSLFHQSKCANLHEIIKYKFSLYICIIWKIPTVKGEHSYFLLNLSMLQSYPSNKTKEIPRKELNISLT